jgi:hypothetical protein
VHSDVRRAVPIRSASLCRLLATLHDRPHVPCAGLVRTEAADLDLTESMLRADAGVVDGVSLIAADR